MDRRFLETAARELGAGRSRRQVLGTATKGMLVGLGGALIPGVAGTHRLGRQLVSSALAQDAMVEIKDFAYSPATLEVSVGSTVTWTNNDDVPHTVTADDDSFNSGTLDPGATFAHLFEAEGSVPYHCNFHDMHAQVVVKTASPTPVETYIRRSVHTLSDAQLKVYADGVKAMKDRDTETGTPEVWRTSWLFQANMHGVPPSVRDDLGADELKTRLWATCQHHQWFFLSWHRMYLYWFERILRKASPDPSNFALPYWDYSVFGQRVLPAAFFTPADDTNHLYLAGRGGFVSGGAVWPPEFEVIFNHEPGLAYKNFSHISGLTRLSFGGQEFALSATEDGHQGPDGGQLENAPHDYVHGYVGGLMGDPDTAANDPIFWLHHANIDRLWERWRSLGDGRNGPPGDSPWWTQPFSFWDEDGQEVQMTGTEIVDTLGQLGYVYDDPLITPPTATPESGSVPIATPSSSAGQSTVLGQSTNEIVLGPEATQVTIAFQSEASQVLDEIAAPPEVGGPQPLVVLTLENVRGTGVPGVTSQVYIGLPQGEQPNPTSPYFVGLISLFGRQPNNLHEHDEPRQSFNITENLRILDERGERPREFALTFVPFEFGPPVAGNGTPEAEAAAARQGPWVVIQGVTVTSE